MPDPVSWMVIEQGWSVVDSEGDEVGRIDEVLGDVVERDANLTLDNAPATRPV